MTGVADTIPIRVTDPQRLARGAATDVAFIAGEGVPVPPGSAVERIAAPAHAPGCACCVPRAALAAALHRLFVRRARGEVPFFRRIVVAAEAEAVAAALADPLVAARFRLEGGPERGAAFRCDNGSM